MNNYLQKYVFVNPTEDFDLLNSHLWKSW